MTSTEKNAVDQRPNFNEEVEHLDWANAVAEAAFDQAIGSIFISEEDKAQLRTLSMIYSELFPLALVQDLVSGKLHIVPNDIEEVGS